MNPSTTRKMLAGMLLLAISGVTSLPVSAQPVGMPQIDLGTWHGCAFYPADGNLNCWGSHPIYGSVYGADQDYLDGDAIDFGVGDYDSCVLRTDGNTQCWGYMSRAGKNMSYAGGDAVEVAVGYASSCVLTAAGNVKCLGSYVAGTDAAFIDVYTGGDAEFVVMSSYAVCFKTAASSALSCRGWNVTEPQWQVRNPQGDALNTALPAAGGHYAMCILTAEGNGDCMNSGYNEVGQTSIGYVAGDAIDLDAQFDKSCVATSRGTVECWGRRANTQPFQVWTVTQASDGIGAGAPVGVSVGAIAAGVYDICWIDAQGTVECVYGQADEYNGGGIPDTDGDGIDDETDNCPLDFNEFQEDTDGDGVGDVCDSDRDGDGIDNAIDNCPTLANPDQADFDSDGAGDACDADADADGVDDAEGDLCPGTTTDPIAGVAIESLGKNRWAELDGNGLFETNGKNPTGRVFLMSDTGGCSCAQIIEICGYGEGHVKHGCSNSVMDTWTGLHDRAEEPPFQCKTD